MVDTELERIVAEGKLFTMGTNSLVPYPIYLSILKFNKLTELIIAYLVSILPPYYMAPTTLNVFDHTMSNPSTKSIMALLENAAATP